MSERVPGSGFGQEAAVGVARAFGYRHDAVLVALHAFADALQKAALVERDLRKQDDVRSAARILARQTGRRCDPARVPAHDLENEDLGRSLCHGLHVQRRFHDRNRHVLGHGTESRAGVGHRKVVVHGLGNPDARDGEPEFRAELGHLVRGVHGIAAAVVEEIADVVGLEHLDQPFVLGAVLVQPLELVTRGAERAARGVAQCRDRLIGLLAGVDHVFGERTDDAVAAGVDLADTIAVPSRSLEHAAGRDVDDGGDPAGLRVESVLLHDISPGERVFSGAQRIPEAFDGFRRD